MQGRSHLQAEGGEERQRPLGGGKGRCLIVQAREEVGRSNKAAAPQGGGCSAA